MKEDTQYHHPLQINNIKKLRPGMNSINLSHMPSCIHRMSETNDSNLSKSLGIIKEEEKENKKNKKKINIVETCVNPLYSNDGYENEEDNVVLLEEVNNYCDNMFNILFSDDKTLTTVHTKKVIKGAFLNLTKSKFGLDIIHPKDRAVVIKSIIHKVFSLIKILVNKSKLLGTYNMDNADSIPLRNIEDICEFFNILVENMTKRSTIRVYRKQRDHNGKIHKYVVTPFENQRFNTVNNSYIGHNFRADKYDAEEIELALKSLKFFLDILSPFDKTDVLSVNQDNKRTKFSFYFLNSFIAVNGYYNTYQIYDSSQSEAKSLISALAFMFGSRFYSSNLQHVDIIEFFIKDILEKKQEEINKLLEIYKNICKQSKRNNNDFKNNISQFMYIVTTLMHHYYYNKYYLNQPTNKLLDECVNKFMCQVENELIITINEKNKNIIFQKKEISNILLALFESIDKTNNTFNLKKIETNNKHKYQDNEENNEMTTEQFAYNQILRNLVL